MTGNIFFSYFKQHFKTIINSQTFDLGLGNGVGNLSKFFLQETSKIKLFLLYLFTQITIINIINKNSFKKIVGFVNQNFKT